VQEVDVERRDGLRGSGREQVLARQPSRRPGVDEAVEHLDEHGPTEVR
jgi:hypothetical protein